MLRKKKSLFLNRILDSIIYSIICVYYQAKMFGSVIFILLIVINKSLL
ncbi:hypothetical protein OENI_160035 [Oenococcus oeni]|nr:hypothetical protein OENI_160035 [Oenococcus oeni]